MAIVIDGRTFEDQGRFVAEGRRCGTPELNAFQKQRIRVHTASLRSGAESLVASIRDIVIPVQFHVIYDGGKGQVADAVLDDQLQVLNDSYTPHSIRFTKAGVTRTDDARWYSMTIGSFAERQAKTQLGVDTSGTLNFYTAGIGEGLLGWATFPSELAGDPAIDGVVVLHSTLPGGTSTPYDLGLTAVHEVGHWLGLYHTFEGGCTAPGDEVDDTPAEASPNYGPANPARNTCPGPGNDPTTNYMDYTDDAGMNEFTPGQVRRIREHVALYRPRLLGAALGAERGRRLAIDFETGAI
jgi:hypothetical protein